NAFFGDDEIELALPENWDVQEARMAGHDRPALSDEEMRQAIQNTYGSPRLSELAKDAKQVCILFDDIPKPTPASRIVPFVLEELHAGGVTDEQIRFICAPGTHRPLVYSELEAKLGRDIIEKYPVYNHSIWENVVHMGQTDLGTPVWVNREFASCDLRVAIGSLFPHGSAGFGGGGKIIMPGVSGIETISYHHANRRGSTQLGQIEGNVFRADLENAARLAGLHFKVDAVLNNRREVVGLFAGDLVEEHRAGAELARELYTTETVEDADILITNSYPDESQLGRAFWCIGRSLREGGDVVVLSHSRDGQNLHQLSGRWGTDYGGRGFNPNRGTPALDKVGQMIIMSPILSNYDRPNGDNVIWRKTWAETLAELASRHGPGTKVGVYPYAPLQMPVMARVPEPVGD
ncbi:MAG: lactate racemase domain-containing protein, partial [SAR202 cluster bacterium]|nr:lactate racemase domain-containing protein [SAR202 cluster bacterium]